MRATLGIVEGLGQLSIPAWGRSRRCTWPCAWGFIPGWWWWGRWGGTRQEQLALGETPNLAARLQGLAASNTVVISAATWQLLSGFLCLPVARHTSH